LPSRRRLLAAAALTTATLWLAACGGGSSSGSDPVTGNPPPPAGPRIQSFAAASATVYIGERPLVTATFSGGQGRVEPIGPVASGVAFSVPVLDRALRLTLHVEAPGQPSATRTLDLVPRYRDRYEPLAGALGVQAHAAVPLPDGGLAVVGGSRGGTMFSTAVDRFDPETRRFTTVAQMSLGRVGHQAVRLRGGPRNGQLLVVGGILSLETELPAEVVDLAEGSATEVGRPVEGRLEHVLVALPGGRVLVVGGLGRDSLELWDAATGEFRLVAARMRHARAAPAVELLDDGRVLIVGGVAEDDADYVLAELFDPESETFSPVTTPLAERRHGDRAHRRADGQVLLLGGERPVLGGLPLGDGEPADTVLRFDPATATLQRHATLDTPRSRMASVMLPDDTLLLFGGRTPARDATAESLGLQGSALHPVAALPNARRMATAHRLPDGRVLVFGGGDGGEAHVASVLVYE
jgi:hypothetical protein